jgi:hypothetical protein
MMVEPTTAITDFIMAAVAAGLGLRLRGAWRLAFLFTGIAAFMGGIYHSTPSVIVWKITVYSVGLGTLFLIIAAAPRLKMFAIIEFIVYAIWMATHDSFTYVIADYGSGMLILAAVYAMRYRASPQASRLILASVAVSAIGAAVQASGFTLHPRFNHNDLYHVIQIGALVLLYKGARLSINARTASASV